MGEYKYLDKDFLNYLDCSKVDGARIELLRASYELEKIKEIEACIKIFNGEGGEKFYRNGMSSRYDEIWFDITQGDSGLGFSEAQQNLKKLYKSEQDKVRENRFKIYEVIKAVEEKDCVYELKYDALYKLSKIVDEINSDPVCKKLHSLKEGRVLSIGYSKAYLKLLGSEPGLLILHRMEDNFMDFIECKEQYFQLLKAKNYLKKNGNLKPFADFIRDYDYKLYNTLDFVSIENADILLDMAARKVGKKVLTCENESKELIDLAKKKGVLQIILNVLKEKDNVSYQRICDTISGKSQGSYNNLENLLDEELEGFNVD